MRLPKFRVRTLLIIVAIVGLICGGGETLRRRRANFRQEAHDLRWAEYVEWHGERRPNVAEYYNRLARKYEYAARYPWLPVAPDPPEPR